jgi:hypothetical protein
MNQTDYARQAALAAQQNMGLNGLLGYRSVLLEGLGGISDYYGSQNMIAVQNRLVPAPGMLSGALTDDEVKALRQRTRTRQEAAFQALKASGKSLLSVPVKRLES